MTTAGTRGWRARSSQSFSMPKLDAVAGSCGGWHADDSCHGRVGDRMREYLDAMVVGAGSIATCC
jgi:hypothetical protein